MSFIVAIDGPAGTGKGTVSKIIGEKYSLTNIDTGAMYRCVALKAIENNVELSEEQKIIDISSNINIDINYINGNQVVILDGKDVTKRIRHQDVTDIVSPVSAIIGVRINMVELQRKMSIGKQIIMEGRDITTYVFPNADVKIYLDADVEVRAKRRYQENLQKGNSTPYEEVLKSIIIRDENDKNKQMGALKIAPDAVYIDTTNLSIEQVVDKVSNIIESKRS